MKRKWLSSIDRGMHTRVPFSAQEPFVDSWRFQGYKTDTVGLVAAVEIGSGDFFRASQRPALLA